MAPSDTNQSIETSSLDQKLSDEERMNKLFGKNIFDDGTAENKEGYDEENIPSKKNTPEKKAYDPRRARTFFIMLTKASLRHQARLKAHTEFHEQVDKLKTAVQTAVKQPPKERKVTINNEIDDLKRKVSYMVEIERGMAAAPSSPEHEKFQTRLAELEKKIDWLIAHKEAREQRFNKLEEKITARIEPEKETRVKKQQESSAEHDTAIDELVQRLLILQKNHLLIKIKAKSIKPNSLERKKVETELTDIKRKIDLTKQAIIGLRE